MAGEREQIMTAIVAALGSINDGGSPPAALKFVTRRMRDPDGVQDTDRPCIYLHEQVDAWEVESRGVGGIDYPPVRSLTIWVLLYTSTAGNENAIPSMQVNGFIEAIEAMFVPRNPVLAGVSEIVRSIMLEGEGFRAIDKTGYRCLTALPIKIRFAGIPNNVFA